MGCLDGSTNGRFPVCVFEVIDSAGIPVKSRLSGCGNMNTLRPEDFVAVAPGKSFDPCGEGFSKPHEFARFPVQQPGIYKVRFSYSSKSYKVSEYFGDERLAALLGKSGLPGLPVLKPEILPLFERIAHIELKSNELALTFVPKSP